MSDVDKDALLAEFQNITGCESERAQFYLESANMQLDLAIASFYENDGQELEAPPGGVDMDTVDPTEATPPPKPAGGAGVGAGAAPGAGRINIKEPDGDDSSSDEEGQAFFAGGSSTSGNVILGPGKKKKKDIVENVFKAAREAGAEEVQESGASGSSKPKIKAFSGGGFKLGDESTPSVQVGQAGPSKEKSDEPRNFLLKMWQNGFSIDDGELRPYDDPQNREFLASIMRGAIPNELVREARGGEVHVDMEDHRQEEFVKPKTKAKPFQGQGQVLGSIAPSVAPTASPSADPAQAEAAAKAALGLNESEPTTSLQVRMADGTRLIVKMNHTHTVANLRTYITTARPQYSSVNFVLVTTFPPAELTDESKTLKEAGLLGAAVLQRLK